MLEKPSEQKAELPPQFSKKEFRQFLKNFKIAEEDYGKIEKIIQIIEGWNWFSTGDVPGREMLVVEFHNFFTFAREETPKRLEELKSFPYRPENYGEFLDLLAELSKKYGYRAPDILLKTLVELGITNFRPGIDKLP
jgi:hypothetical protein